MKTRKLIFAFCLLFLMTGISNGQTKDSNAPFFFIQLTDPQFGMFESNSGFGKETELYEKAVNAINRVNPDFVVITGDLVNNKEDKTQIAEFKRITSKINSSIPVFYSPGNHDIGQSPGQKDIDLFISNYGHDKFSFEHKKTLFISLNSCIIKDNTPKLEQIQFDWLKKELLKGKSENHIILFCHYPFFLNTFDEPETYSNIPVEIRNRYLSLLKENQVDAVFAGHLHNNVSAKYGAMDMITTSAVGKPLGEAPSGVRIVKVYSNRIESVYYGVNEIPAKIIFSDNPASIK
jgi:3',5'-cyclic AMP phosphodiesterase CpdA